MRDYECSIPTHSVSFFTSLHTSFEVLKPRQNFRTFSFTLRQNWEPVALGQSLILAFSDFTLTSNLFLFPSFFTSLHASFWLFLVDSRQDVCQQRWRSGLSNRPPSCQLSSGQRSHGSGSLSTHAGLTPDPHAPPSSFPRPGRYQHTGLQSPDQSERCDYTGGRFWSFRPPATRRASLQRLEFRQDELYQKLTGEICTKLQKMSWYFKSSLLWLSFQIYSWINFLKEPHAIWTCDGSA